MAKRVAKEGVSRPLDATCRMVVLHGVEDFLLQVYTNALRESLIKVHGEIDTVTFNGESAKAADILDECRSFGLIATHKLILVDHADEVVKEENRALFERYAQGLIESGGEAGATLVLRCKSWRAGKLDKLIEQIGTIKECREVTDAEAIKWSMERCKKRHSAELTREAADLLIARVGPSLGRIDSELGKLAAAAGVDASGKTNPITPQVVAEFVKVSREEEIWAMQGTLLTGDLPRILSELNYAIEISREAPAKIFFAFTDLARKVHAASHGVRQGMNAWQLKGPLKLWGSSADAIVAAGQRIPPADARRLLRASLNNLYRDRSGLGDDVRTLERTALEFALASRRQR
jgi:DNA polymerase III subunit delta